MLAPSADCLSDIGKARRGRALLRGARQQKSRWQRREGSDNGDAPAADDEDATPPNASPSAPRDGDGDGAEASESSLFEDVEL